MWFRALVVVLTTASISSGSAPGQTVESQARDEVQWPVDVARNLIDKQQFVQVPPKGKTNPKFDKTTPVFSMTAGKSPVVLLRLPDYREPYTMTVSSTLTGWGRTKHI